jgi:ribonuclease E
MADETTPAKPARKRAPRKAAAPAPETLGEGALAEAALDTPPAKPARKRAPRKAVAPEAETPTETAETEAPKKRTRARKAAPPAAEPVIEAGPPPLPVVTFVAPEVVTPPPRKRAPRIVLDEPVTAAEAPAEEDETEETPGEDGAPRKRRRRGRRGRGKKPGEGTAETTDETEPEPEAETAEGEGAEGESDDTPAGTKRRRRRRRGGGAAVVETVEEDGVPTVVKVRPAAEPRSEVQGIKGSTRLEAKRQRRRDGRDQSRRRPPIVTEAEFLARREAVERLMLVRQTGDTTQIAVLEDDVLVEHYVTRASATSYAGNVYLGRVQNVLPSMEAAFVDIGKGRNAVLYAGEVNYDASALEGRPPRIEQALKSGQQVVVQVTKDPIGHKGARLTSQISLPGRYMVYVPEQSMTGISRKLPDTERSRLKSLLKTLKPEGAGVIIRTAAEGASEEDLTADLRRLQAQWEVIEKKAKKEAAPALLHGEPDLVIRVVRDNFNEDFAKLIVEGDEDFDLIEGYLSTLAPDLLPRLERHTGDKALFDAYRVDEQIAKALDRKVSLPSGGSLVIDRTEAMTVVDVNTGKFTGKGGNLEETVTKNNLEAAEEIVRQLRLRDIGGIIVVDFIDMILESNRELVARRLKECLGRDRTKHQVAELTSLGLLQMTRKRISQGLFEAFTETCAECGGRGVKVHTEFPTGGKQKAAPSPAQVAKRAAKPAAKPDGEPKPARSRRGRKGAAAVEETPEPLEAPKVEEPLAAAEADAPAETPAFDDVTPPEWQFAAATPSE